MQRHEGQVNLPQQQLRGREHDRDAARDARGTALHIKRRERELHIIGIGERAHPYGGGPASTVRQDIPDPLQIFKSRVHRHRHVVAQRSGVVPVHRPDGRAGRCGQLHLAQIELQRVPRPTNAASGVREPEQRIRDHPAHRIDLHRGGSLPDIDTDGVMGAHPLEVYHPVHEVRAIRRATHIVQTDLQGEHAIASRAREDRVRCPWRDHRDAPPINRDGINADVITEAGGGTRRRRGCIAGDDVGNVPRSFFLALEIEAQATDRQARKMNRALQQSDDVEGAVDLLGRDHRDAGGVEERHIFKHDVRGTDGAQHPDAQRPSSTEQSVGT